MCGKEMHFSGKNLIIFLSFLILLCPAIPLLVALSSIRPMPTISTGFVLIYSIALLFYIYFPLICINMIRQIRVDEDNLYILKSKKSKTIPFSQIKHITYSTGKGGGIYYFWIRKKDEIENIETSFFTISALLGSNKNYRKLLLNKLEQRTTLKKSKII